MPFQSKAQQGYLYANNPAVAKEFASKTPDMKNLPEHKKRSKGKPGRSYSSDVVAMAKKMMGR